jgi:hypothetical protein
MSDKVALPSLDLPGQKTHWAVIAVVGGAVLVLAMAAIFLIVVHKQQASQEAAVRAVEARAKEAAAQVEKLKLEAVAAAEKAKAAAAAAAAEKAKPATPVAVAEGAGSASDGDPNAAAKKKAHKSGRKQGRSGVPTTARNGGDETPAPSRKADPSLDALLRGLK